MIRPEVRFEICCIYNFHSLPFLLKLSFPIKVFRKRYRIFPINQTNKHKHKDTRTHTHTHTHTHIYIYIYIRTYSLLVLDPTESQCLPTDSCPYFCLSADKHERSSRQFRGDILPENVLHNSCWHWRPKLSLQISNYPNSSRCCFDIDQIKKILA